MSDDTKAERLIDAILQAGVFDLENINLQLRPSRYAVCPDAMIHRILVLLIEPTTDPLEPHSPTDYHGRRYIKKKQ